MCQPGKPGPHGESHTSWRRSPARFHSAQSAWNRLASSTAPSKRWPGRSASSRFPDSAPYVGKLVASKIVDSVLQQLKVSEVAPEPVTLKKPRAREAAGSTTYGINVIGVEDVLVRLARCCTPVPGDDIVGYISLGKGITIHRGDCPNVRALRRNPERFTPVEWEGGGTQSFRVQIALDSWDRPRLLEDVARTFAEHGANIVGYGGTVEDQMARNWYTAEIGDVKALRSLLTALRNVDGVFDARRMTPS